MTQSAESVRLRIQTLPGPLQALAVSALVAMRTDEGVFRTNQVTELFRRFRLPDPANMSATLGRLRAQDLLMRPHRDSWALTPLGEARLMEEAAHVLEGVTGGAISEGSEFGDQHHALIPPFLGPMGAAPGLTRVLDSTPFDENVMLITRFPKGPEDHFAELIPKLRSAVSAHGLTLLVASDRTVEDTLWANVVTYMWACKYAIVLMDSAKGVLNSNVLIEIGGMLITGRRCAILRDTSVPAMPSDLVGHIYKSTDLANHAATVDQVHRWIRDDLGLPTCESCPRDQLSGQGLVAN